VLEIACSDPAELDRLAELLAPDLAARMRALSRHVEPVVFEQLAPLAPATGVIGLAERPRIEPAAVLADARPLPVILLEDPRDLGNMGACVRVAAAADVAGVLSTGTHDPWHPDALRGAAGLHFALLKKLARQCELSALSMGMSADFETAIRFGATHLRVGTAIFGERGP